MNTKLIIAASALVVLSGCQMTNVIDDMPADLTSFNVEWESEALKVHFSGGMLTEAKVVNAVDEFLDYAGPESEVRSEGSESVPLGFEVSESLQPYFLNDGTAEVISFRGNSILIVSNSGDLKTGEDGTFNPHYTYAATGPIFYGSIGSLDMPKGDLNYEGVLAYTASSDMDIPNLEEENYFSDFDMEVNFDLMTARIVEGVGEQAIASFDSGSLDISNDGTFIGTDGLLNEDPYKNKIYTHGSFTADETQGVFGTFTSDGPFNSDDSPGEITFRGGFVGARALDELN